jgi:hypothetical protein
MRFDFAQAFTPRHTIHLKLNALQSADLRRPDDVVASCPLLTALRLPGRNIFITLQSADLQTRTSPLRAPNLILTPNSAH